MAAVQQKQRVAAQNLDAGGHTRLRQPLQNGFVGDVVTKIAPERKGDLHRHGGVVRLMRAGHPQDDIIAAVVDAVLQPLALDAHKVGGVGRDDAGVRFGCRGQDGSHRLGGLVGVADDGAALGDDAGLLRGNFRQRVAQQLGVVLADFCDGCHQLAGHGVGGIVLAAKTGFQHDDVAFFAGKPQQRQRGDGFKLHGRLASLGADGVDGGKNLLRQRGQRAGGDHLAVDLKALPEVHHIGADGQTGLVPGFGQDGGGHSRQTALAVGAGNMYAGQIVFGVAQMGQQILHTRQSRRTGAQTGQCLQGFDGLLCGHCGSSSCCVSASWWARWAARRARRSCSRSRSASKRRSRSARRARFSLLTAA